MEFKFGIDDGQDIHLVSDDAPGLSFRPGVSPDGVLSVGADDSVVLKAESDSARLDVEESIQFGGSSNYEDLYNKPCA